MLIPTMEDPQIDGVDQDAYQNGIDDEYRLSVNAFLRLQHPT